MWTSGRKTRTGRRKVRVTVRKEVGYVYVLRSACLTYVRDNIAETVVQTSPNFWCVLPVIGSLLPAIWILIRSCTSFSADDVIFSQNVHVRATTKGRSVLSPDSDATRHQGAALIEVWSGVYGCLGRIVACNIYQLRDHRKIGGGWTPLAFRVTGFA